MAAMLRKRAPWVYECCSQCARKTSGPRKPHRLARRRGRARERAAWRREVGA